MAARELLELLKQNAEAAKELAETIASGVDNADFVKGLEEMRGAMLNATDDANNFEGALRKIESAQDSLLTKAQAAIGLIQQELAADLAIAAAKKQALIEEIKAKEALGQLTKAQAQSALADLESKSEKEANERKQRARKDELDQLHLAQKRNRDEFPQAKSEAEAADQEQKNAADHKLRREKMVEAANAALDESKEGSIASQLKKKQEELDKIPLVSQHDYVFGQADDAANLKVQIESLQALKKQAEEQKRKFDNVESEHHYDEALKAAQQKAADAEDRAKKLDEENKALTQKISDAQAANKISTETENTTAQYHDQARAQQNIQNKAQDVDKDISSAHRDIEEIHRMSSRGAVSPQEIAKAREAVADLTRVMAELPRLISTLHQLGAPTKDLQRQIDDLNRELRNVSSRTDRPQS